MKKTLSLALVLTLLIGCFSAAFAAEAGTPTSAATPTTQATPTAQATSPAATTSTTAGAAGTTKAGITAMQLTDITGVANEDAIVANYDLGIITGYEDKTFKPDQSVNRAEFAAMIMRMLNVPTSALASYTKTGFSDMTGYEWSNQYVGFCEAKGIIKGRGTGIFAPGETITVSEAVTMVLRAVGYTENSSELAGIWPANYEMLGKRLGLYENIAASATINRGSAAQVIYNTLTLSIVTVDADGSTHMTYEDAKTGAGKSVIEVYLHCTPTDWMIYDEQEASHSVINTQKYIGGYLRAFKNEEEDVIAIGEVKSVFLTGDYTAAEEEFEVGDVTYTLEDNSIFYKDEENKVQPTEIFVNRRYQTTGAAFTTDGAYTIAVKLSGKTIHEVYSIDAWIAEQPFLYKTDMLEDTKLNDFQFPEDDNNEIDGIKFTLDGIESLDKLTTNHAITVYLANPNSHSSEIARVAVGTKTVSGKIKLVDAPDYTIGAAKYSAVDMLDEDSDVIELGDTGTAYLDYDGKIVCWKVKDSKAGNYAIVTGETLVEGRNKTLRLFDKSGKEKDLILTKEAGYGEDFESNGAMNDADDLKVGDLVCFALNSGGEISSLEYCPVTLSDTDKVSKSRALYGNKKISDNVQVFVYDSSTLANSKFKVNKIANVETDEVLEGTYSYTDYGKIAVMIVNSDYIGVKSVYAVLNSAKETFDNADEKVFVVEGLSSGKTYKAYTNDRDVGVLNQQFSSAATAAAIYELTVSADGAITDAKFTTGRTDKGLPVQGYVIEKDGSSQLKVLTDPTITTSSAVTDAQREAATWYIVDKKAAVYKYDRSKEEFTLARLSDIKVHTHAVPASYVYLYQMEKKSEIVDLIVLINE